MMRVEVYECIGKGGRYQWIGGAMPAGYMKKATGQMVIYRCMYSGQLYVRELADFCQRMRLVEVIHG